MPYRAAGAFSYTHVAVNDRSEPDAPCTLRIARMMTVKYGNAFLPIEMGLVSGQYMTDLLSEPTLPKDDFLASRLKEHKWKSDEKTPAFFNNAHACYLVVQFILDEKESRMR